MDYTPPEFAKIPYGTVTPASCSPKVSDPGFKGIVIRVPEKVVVKGREKPSLPICGYYQLDTGPLVAGAEIHVHVRTADGKAAQSGQVVTDMGENEPDMPDPKAGKIDPARFHGQVSESYFYYDATRYLPHSLPPGEYDVCVSYGQNRSNVARVLISAR